MSEFFNVVFNKGGAITRVQIPAERFGGDPFALCDHIRAKICDAPTRDEQTKSDMRFQRVIGRRAEARADANEERKSPGVAETSVEAYDKLKWSGRMTAQQKIVYDHIRASRDADHTRQELVKLTGLPINVVCGRVNELLKPGLLVETVKRVCRITGETAIGVKAR